MEEPIILRKLSTLPKTAPVNISFENLCYTVKGLKDSKEILHSLSGSFRSGELTAILGPSGSGKTTLIKVLVGYIAKQTSGSIQINKKSRQSRVFHKMSVFIMQEDLLQPLLTVHEAMIMSASLKLGSDTTYEEKKIIVEEILQTLNLESCCDTRVEGLSGGQKKRLAIALELVNNPPVIFLDEPTSGLDTVSAQQCINVLRTLADQGKTIICTIHQPSASIFEKFDQTYFVAEGNCVYNGCPENILTFLSETGLPCPLDYSPAEYVIEIVQTNSEHIPTLTNAIQNGKINHTIFTTSLNLLSNAKLIKRISTNSMHRDIALMNEKYRTQMDFPTTFWTQFLILTKRMWMQQIRNKASLWIHLIQHTLTGLVTGMLFKGFGNSAPHIKQNFMYYLCIVCFFIYTYVMRGIISLPEEIQVVRREYFNRWYSLKAYYSAITLRNLPFIAILGFEIVTITYLMSSQPTELNRFIPFYVINILIAFISEGLGIVLGSIFSIKYGSIFGPALFSILLVLGYYGIGYGPQVPFMWKIIRYISYARYSLVALTLTVLQDRPLLDCPDIVCEVRDTKLFLRDLGMNEPYFIQVVGLIFFVIFYRVMAFFTLKFRLDREFSGKIHGCIFGLIKQK